MDEISTDKSKKNFNIDITIKNIVIIASILSTVIGSSFTVGGVITYKTEKIIQSDLIQAHKNELQTQKLSYMELQTQAKMYEEDAKFFKRQYLIQLDRYNKCESQSPYEKAE